MKLKALLLPSLSLIALTIIVNNPVAMKYFDVYSQPANNDTSLTDTSIGNGSEFILNIRGISSFTESNMAALISTEDDVQAKKVDLDKAIIEPGQENSFSPNKMIDVPILMNTLVKPNSEVTACVLQLGSGTFSQRINCNTVFSESGNTGESQKIIVPLS
jgi:hypothetical protein